jgi:microcystin-dependent protein
MFNSNATSGGATTLLNYGAVGTAPGINNTGGGAAMNNVQPTLVLNYIIKAA